MSTADIQRMSTNERLATMEQLWDALCREGADPVSPSWHKVVLAKRKKTLNSPEAKFLTLEQIREQFR